MKAHSVRRPFVCRYCDFSACTLEELRAHRKVHGVPGSKLLKCIKCPAQFTSRENLKDHFNKHAGRKPHECKLCHFKSSYRPILAAHMLKHDPNKQLSCSHCEYTTHCKVKLKRHTVVHHSQAPFIQCTESGCKYKTKDKNYMTAHINAVHRKDVHYRCKLCDKGFYSKYSFESHFRTHTGERPFKCDLCDYSSGSKSSLLTHQKIHSTTHNVQCPICEKVIRDKYALKNHMKVHSESRQFPCSLCPYRGKTDSSLKSHVKYQHKAELTQEGTNPAFTPKSKKKARSVPYLKVRIRKVVKTIKSYQCPFCDFHTSSLGSFNPHVRRHTGEKPYKCEHCDYSSVQSGNLRRHNLQRHNKGELPLLSCRHCEFQTKIKDCLSRHERRHFPDANKVHKCNQCSFASDNIGNLNVHLRMHSGERPFPCSLCSYRGPTKYCLESHSAVHSEEKPFKCPICDFRAKTQSRMRHHTLSRHGSGRKKMFDCTFTNCTSSYTATSKLRDHIRSKHHKETRFTCPKCPRAFFHNYDLTAHLRTHTKRGERRKMRFKCDLCSHTAATNPCLLLHKKRVHFPSTKDFSCSKCDKAYDDKSQLERHMEVHSMERRHPCPRCAYRAHTKKILKAHWGRCPKRRNSPDTFPNDNNRTLFALSKQTERLLLIKFGCRTCIVKVRRLRIIG